MNNKITKKRLNDLLSYDWITIIATIVAGIVLWVLIFQISAPRLSAGQQVEFMIYGNFSFDKLYDVRSEMNSDNSSFEVQKISVVQTTNDDTASQVLSAKLGVFEGDFIILSKTANDNGDSNFTSVVDGYAIGYSFDDFIADSENYTSSFFDGETIKDKEVEAYFRLRMKKDKRFKTEEQIIKGIEQEKVRLMLIKKDTAALKKFLEENSDCQVKYTLYSQLKKNNSDYLVPETTEKVYGIDLSKLVSTSEYVKNFDGTTTDITLILTNFKKEQGDLQYDSVSLLMQFINDCMTAK